MTDEVKQDINQSGMAKVETVAGKVGTEIGTEASKVHTWFTGHPGTAIAFFAGLVIGFTLGYLIGAI